MALKNFVPPIITDFVRKNQKLVKYKSYEEALSHCTVNAYQNEKLCSIVADKTLIHVKSLNKKPFIVTPTTVYLAFALNYFTNAFDKKTITVLDFGGACGAHYYEVRNMIPQTVSLKWIVVETEQMIRSAVNCGLAKAELSFVSRLEDIKEPVDFIHSSSTLQYVPDPPGCLKKLTDVGARMVLFNRMMFNKNNEDIITVQRSLLSSNGPGKLPPGYTDGPIIYPHTTMAINQMHSMMAAGGYECLSEFDEPSGRISLGKEEILGKGLLFIRKQGL